MSFVSRNHPQQVATRGALDEVDDRGTPDEVFGPLNDRFGPFTLDVAAAHHNARCADYYTRADDGLARPWSGIVWCNPPFSNLSAWTDKAWAELGLGRVERIVMLLPANRTEQGWWQDSIEPHRDQPGSALRVEFLRGRTRFIKAGATEIKPNERPPFGCCLAIWQRP